ncbi:MAG: CheR family methyltransferase [Pseudobdellovibrio sp.]
MKPIDPVEKYLFIEGLFVKYGYDFRNYNEPSFERRLLSLMTDLGYESLLDLLKNTFLSTQIFNQVIAGLTVNTTEFFRDPLFFKELKEQVFPILKTYSKINIWSAGCSTGEEVISLAIALQEEELLKKTTIYATDINPNNIKKAKNAIYSTNVVPKFNQNYTLASGKKSPSDYYTTEYNLIRFNQILTENIVFFEHNLATDSVFLEAHLIICRNVLIYFNRNLQNRTIDLFTKSLASKGILGLGPQETLGFYPQSEHFSKISNQTNIFRLNSFLGL